jgi:hypothetical protein
VSDWPEQSEVCFRGEHDDCMLGGCDCLCHRGVWVVGEEVFPETNGDKGEANSMSEPWTPGPWNAEGERPRLRVYAVPKQEDALKSAWVPRLVAEATTEANARLIAAAPEMVELLKRLRDTVDTMDFQLDQEFGVGPFKPDSIIAETDAFLTRIRGEA